MQMIQDQEMLADATLPLPPQRHKEVLNAQNWVLFCMFSVLLPDHHLDGGQSGGSLQPHNTT